MTLKKQTREGKAPGPRGDAEQPPPGPSSWKPGPSTPQLGLLLQAATSLENLAAATGTKQPQGTALWTLAPKVFCPRVALWLCQCPWGCHRALKAAAHRGTAETPGRWDPVEPPGAAGDAAPRETFGGSRVEGAALYLQKAPGTGRHDLSHVGRLPPALALETPT